MSRTTPRPPTPPLFPYTTLFRSHRVFGLSALLDQRLGAVVMFAEQALTVGTALVLLLRPSLRSMPSDAPSTVARLCQDRKSIRLNSSHANISYAVFCLKKKKHYK